MKWIEYEEAWIPSVRQMSRNAKIVAHTRIQGSDLREE